MILLIRFKNLFSFSKDDPIFCRAKAVDESLTMYLSIYGEIDELLPLKEFAKGTPYSQEYLSLRARQGILEAVKTGKSWYASKRAVEEYLSEHGMK